MAFTINDFQDLVQLLEENPRWRNELRRLIVNDEFAQIMQSIRDLIALSDKHEARLTRVESDISEIKTDVAVLKTDVASLKGAELERTFRERPYVYLSRFARRIRLVSDSELAILIEGALDQKRLTEDEAEDLKRLDAIAKGKHKVQNYDVYLAVEASSVADEHDLERAQRRAKLLEKATGIPAFPVIAGDVSAKGIMQLAESRGVYWVSRT